ncbi:hypothetical protein SAMN05421505_10837 [Sinosporangium album]|uniref:O-acetyl-ADP-ribose deacetylase (Regulator of RNase III), contains Macro domain n=1 Tax=Sinosporangium album TaxID=504805 RepID=A0A1G7X4K3_9ACTN|nr:hypothetical protein [Sinosporangium album]SDG79148.1 hypothetical protein SAMN05421505_10837 [Sinosporangium album]
MPESSELPHADLIAELRIVRERGLLRLRQAPLPSLTACAERLGLPTAGGLLPTSITTMLHRVVAELGEGTLAGATALTLGVAPGTRDMAAQDRRRKAADVYGVSVERFRKHHERLILEHVADKILDLCQRTVPPPPRDAEPVPPSVPAVRLRMPHRRGDLHLTVHGRRVETLSGIDVLVSSENVYLEMAKTFKSSLSGTLRNVAARRNALGEVVDDVLQRELHEWLHKHSRTGMPVAPGTVIATSPGELVRQGVRRIYHAATAIPRPHTDDYAIEPAGVLRAVHGVFALAREERPDFDPPLRSVCLPLFGSGRGGLPLATSLAYAWPALEAELAEGDWDVHLITRDAEGIRAVLAALADLGARRADPLASH